jgi:hypothetical protein
MIMGGSQGGAMVLTDTEGADFIVRCGGALMRAEPGDLDECLWSVSQTQMLHAHINSNGAMGMGAHTEGKSLTTHFPRGHVVETDFQSGLMGLYGTCIGEGDPRFNCALVVGHREKRGVVLKKMALLSSFDLPWRAEHKRLPASSRFKI